MMLRYTWLIMPRGSWVRVCAVAVLALASAWAKPNFSGDWRLNAAKSDFGSVPAPEKMERKITHEDPSLKMITTQSGPQGEVTTELAYKTDGSPSTNKIRGREMTGVAQWEGDVLTISTKREVQGMEVTTDERWTLSPDGKTLTINTKAGTPNGEFKIKLVMDKQ